MVRQYNINIRLNKWERETLNAEAEKHDTTKTEIVRRALDRFLALCASPSPPVDVDGQKIFGEIQRDIRSLEVRINGRMMTAKDLNDRAHDRLLVRIMDHEDRVRALETKSENYSSRIGALEGGALADKAATKAAWEAIIDRLAALERKEAPPVG